MDTSCTEEDLDFESEATLKCPAQRLWMTQSRAVLMAALCGDRGVAEDEGMALHRGAAFVSPYGVGETVHRIRATALSRGLPVLACVGARQKVVVLTSSQGGTPVLMDAVNARFGMPLSMLIRISVSGMTEVLLGTSLLEAPQAGPELPAYVAQDIASLPALVLGALAMH